MGAHREASQGVAGCGARGAWLLPPNQGRRGGAPGGAGPYVTGVARLQRRVRVTGLDRGARAGPPQGSAEGAPAAPLAELYGGFAKGCLVSIPWGLASPWRLPALHPLVSRERKRGTGRPGALKKTKPLGSAVLADSNPHIAGPRHGRPDAGAIHVVSCRQFLAAKPGAGRDPRAFMFVFDRPARPRRRRKVQSLRKLVSAAAVDAPQSAELTRSPR
jgi:hypothetical protein